MAARQPTTERRSPAQADASDEHPDPLDGDLMLDRASELEPPLRLFEPLPHAEADDRELERLRAEVDELRVVAERLRARALASQRETVLLSEHLTTRGSLVGSLRLESQTLRRELDRAHDERDAVRLERDAAERELRSVRTSLDAREAELALLRADVDEHVAVADALTLEANELRGELESARSLGTDLTSRVEALTSDLATARDTSASLRAELAAARSDAEWQAGQARRAREAATEAERRAEEAERAVADGAVGTAPGRPAPGTGAPPESDTRALSEALEQARTEARESAARLAEAEQSRDQLAISLSAVATTGPGRVARRWVRFGAEHPRGARLMRAPFVAAWTLLTFRWPHWLRQHPLFDREWYLEVNRDVRDSRIRPWWHYLRHGIREGRAPNRYFDREWYLRTYPDVRMVGMDPLDHYYRFGGWEGRDPSPRFRSAWYLAQHPDVVAAGVNPLLHFLRWGLDGGYQPRPLSSGRRVPASGRTAGSWSAVPPQPRADPPPFPPGPSGAATAAIAAPVGSVDVGRVKRVARSALPAGARPGVVSDGNRDLLAMPGIEVVPVPRADDGGPARDIPRNDLSAIAHVESLRVTHVDQLVVPEPSLWLTIVPGLQRHLDRRYAALARGEGATVYDVRAPRTRPAGEAGEHVDALLRRVRERLGREPSVLDWDSGAPVDPDTPGVSLFTPPSASAGPSLPYADGSIDIVLVPAGAAERLSEARRAASSLVVGVGAGGDAEVVEWLGDAAVRPAESVSIVIPTYQDATLIAACLRTIDETAEGDDVEVIVSDDGSGDAYREALEALVSRYARVRLVRSERNGGYIAAVNAGAATAANKVLVFLNNDTILLPGWLEPLLDTLRDRPATGVVGGMLLYPDGRLQEAGCAIFRDGSATKIGFGDGDPTLPYYAYPRSVDYVSGALMATPREVFERLGGLDPAFGFGYYEDGDYCFRARREGLDVVYQPRSVIVHVEGGTAGTDLTKGAKRYQATNQALFVDRWRAELERQPVRPEPLDIHASRDLVIRGRPSPAT